MYIGIDIGGTNTKIGITDKDGLIVAKTSFKTDCTRGIDKVLDDIENTVFNLATSNGVINNIQGIGMGIPGLVDGKTGTVRCATNLGWNNVALADIMKKRFSKRLGNIRLKISNDANCAALGEYKFGKGGQISDMILITIGTGVGSGIIINGKIFEGNGGAGAEAGHITLIQAGIPCNCGKNGCWEKYASATALVNQTKEAFEAHPSATMEKIIGYSGKITGRTAFDAMRAGDKLGKQIVEKYLEYLSSGIISLINLLHPEVVVIGGGISNEKEFVTSPLQKQVDAYIKKSNFYPKVKIAAASLGNDAGLLGAAALNM